jgi:hypothetical protein
MTSPPVLVERTVVDTVPVVTHRVDIVLPIDRDVIADVVSDVVATTDIRTIPDVGSIANVRPVTDTRTRPYGRQCRWSITRTSR